MHIRPATALSLRSLEYVQNDILRAIDDDREPHEVRFPPRLKDFFFTSRGSLFPFTRANAQWVIHGFK